jgi:hypothetical protein
MHGSQWSRPPCPRRGGREPLERSSGRRNSPHRCDGQNKLITTMLHSAILREGGVTGSEMGARPAISAGIGDPILRGVLGRQRRDAVTGVPGGTVNSDGSRVKASRTTRTMGVRRHERVNSSEFAEGLHARPVFSCVTLRQAGTDAAMFCRDVAALQPEWLYGARAIVARIAIGLRSGAVTRRIRPRPVIVDHGKRTKHIPLAHPSDDGPATGDRRRTTVLGVGARQ